MNQQPAPNSTPISMEQRAGLEDYLLSGEREVRQLLHELHQRRALITAHFGGHRSFLTAILGLSTDERTLVLDASPDTTTMSAALAAGKLICVTQLEQIRIQFVVRNARAVAEKGRKLIHAPVPEQILRLQRRATYRLLVPISHQASGWIQLLDQARQPLELHGRLLDLSIGGIALLLPQPASALVIGARLERCRLQLPGHPLLEVTLRVCYLNRQEQRSGIPMLRVGFAFSELPRQYEILIQRYIFQTERERKALETGEL